MYVSALLK